MKENVSGCFFFLNSVYKTICVSIWIYVRVINVAPFSTISLATTIQSKLLNWSVLIVAKGEETEFSTVFTDFSTPSV